MEIKAAKVVIVCLLPIHSSIFCLYLFSSRQSSKQLVQCTSCFVSANSLCPCSLFIVQITGAAYDKRIWFLFLKQVVRETCYQAYLYLYIARCFSHCVWRNWGFRDILIFYMWLTFLKRSRSVWLGKYNIVPKSNKWILFSLYSSCCTVFSMDCHSENGLS